MYNSLLKHHSEKELLKYIHLQNEVPLDNITKRNFDKYHISNELSFCEANNKDLREMLRKAYKIYYADGRRRTPSKLELVGV